MRRYEYESVNTCSLKLEKTSGRRAVDLTFGDYQSEDTEIRYRSEQAAIVIQLVLLQRFNNPVYDNVDTALVKYCVGLFVAGVVDFFQEVLLSASLQQY